MKIACSTLHYENANHGVFEAIDSIGTIGYEGVEMTFGSGYIAEDIPELPDTGKLDKCLNKNKLQLSAVHSNLHWGYVGEKIRKNRILLERLVDLALDLGGDHLVIPTGRWPEDLDRNTVWRNIVENYSWATNMALKKGIKLAIEAVVTWPI